MSRLYYSSKSASSAAGRNMPLNTAGGGNEPDKQGALGSEYAEKISKIVPIEVIGAFMAILAIARGDTEIGGTVSLIAFCFCLVLTPCYLWFLSRKDSPDRTKVIHLVLSTISFAIWAYAVAGMDFCPELYNRTVAGVLPIFFTLISGLVPLSMEQKA